MDENYIPFHNYIRQKVYFLTEMKFKRLKFKLYLFSFTALKTTILP